jgi:hypothetical protein
MAIYGNQVYDGAGGQWGAFNCYVFGNWDKDDMGAMPSAGSVSTFHFHAEIENSCTVVAHIYEIDTDNVDDSFVLASSSQVVFGGGESVASWHSLAISATLEEGKYYGLVLQVNTTPQYTFKMSWDVVAARDNGWKTASCYTPIDPIGAFTDRGAIFAMYVSYQIPGRTPTSDTYAPVAAIPRLTSGRNGSGYSSGHEVKYTLDNDMDTYWLADGFTDHTIYFDLGESQSVEAVSMWIRDYNYGYNVDKAWYLSWSTDDITYNDLSTKKFADYRTNGHPVVVDVLSTATSARYWSITFIDFDNMPQFERVAISGVWFLNRYPLPYKHEKPQIETIQYRNNASMNRANIHFVEDAGVGSTRLRKRDYIFIKTTDQWENLRDAFRACKGKLKPLFIQSDLSNSDYYALHFTTGLNRREIGYEFFKPSIILRDPGHELVSLPAMGLYPTPDVGGWWKFQEDLTDESANGNDLSAASLDSTAFIAAVCETGKTALPTSAYTGSMTRVHASVAGLSMGSSTDFSIEFIACTTTSASNTRIISKLDESGSGDGWYAGFDNGKVRARIADGTNSVHGNGLVTINDGKWHYIAIVFSRTADTVTVYVDGELDLSWSISTVTGDIDNTTDIFAGSAADTYLDEIMISRVALSAIDVQERAEDLKNDYGTWGR